MKLESQEDVFELAASSIINMCNADLLLRQLSVVENYQISNSVENTFDQLIIGSLDQMRRACSHFAADDSLKKEFHIFFEERSPVTYNRLTHDKIEETLVWCVTDDDVKVTQTEQQTVKSLDLSHYSEYDLKNVTLLHK